MDTFCKTDHAVNNREGHMMKKNLLIIDSNPIMLKTMVGLLKSQSELFNVLSAKNGSKAFGIMAEHPVDLVITGLHLQEIDTYEFVSKIDQMYPHIRIIVMTNNASTMLRDKIKQLPTATHFDQTADLGLLTKRIFSELNINYGGRIRGIDLSSFLQILELDGRSCKLHISAKGKTGELFILEGRLVAAVNAKLRGNSAALQILTWENICIEIDYSPVEREVEITAPLMSLLLDSGRLIDKKQNSKFNKRKYPRRNLQATMHYYISEWTHQCYCKDLSFGGAYVETDQAIAVGQIIDLSFSSPEFICGYPIKSQVVRRDKKGIGITFNNLGDDKKKILMDLISNGAASLNSTDLGYANYIEAA